jgi:hypothetical protein
VTTSAPALAPTTRRGRREARARRRATWRFFAGICAFGALMIAFSIVVTFAF